MRQAKGLKDRVVYLTDVVVNVLATYLEVRGPALSDHLFIYRHKQVSKDLIRLRVKAAGKRVQFSPFPRFQNLLDFVLISGLGEEKWHFRLKSELSSRKHFQLESSKCVTPDRIIELNSIN